MTRLITIESRPTFRDLSGRYARATDRLLDIRREEMRQVGRRVVSVMKSEAPKRTGAYAGSIRFRTGIQGDAVTLTTYSAQPLGRFIIQGTRPHIITPKGPGYPLRFVVNGQVVYTYLVRHPGTKPNNYPARALDRLRPELTAVLRTISNKWVLLAGGK